MIINFPEVCPAAEGFLAFGRFPNEEFQAVSGARLTKNFGQYAYSLRLSRPFGQIEDSDAVSIVDAWINSLGGFYPVSLPSIIFSDLTPEEIAAIPETISWTIENEPEVRSVAPGWSNVTVTFIGELDG